MTLLTTDDKQTFEDNRHQDAVQRAPQWGHTGRPSAEKRQVGRAGAGNWRGRTVWKAVREAGHVELRGPPPPPVIPSTIQLGFGYTDFEVLREQIITSRCDRSMGQGTEI